MRSRKQTRMIRPLNWQWRECIFKTLFNLRSHFSLRESSRSVASLHSGERPWRIPLPGGSSNRGCWWMQQMENQNWQLYSMPIQLHQETRQNKMLRAWGGSFFSVLENFNIKSEHLEFCCHVQEILRNPYSAGSLQGILDRLGVI